MPECYSQAKGAVERSLHRAKGRAEKAKTALVQHKATLAATLEREQGLQQRLQATTEELREVWLLFLPLL